MGTLLLEDFLTEVRFDLRNRPDTSASGLSDARLTRYVNWAYYHVAHPSVHKHRAMMYTFTIPLVANQKNYLFNPVAGVTIVGIRSVSHIADTTDSLTAARTKLRARDAQWFDDRSLSSQSSPYTYAVEGEFVWVEPVPSAAEAGELLHFRAYRQPAALVAGQATVLMDPWDEAIILGARWRAELHLGYRDLAEATKMDFGALINEFKEWDNIGAEDWDWSAGLRLEPVM